MSTRKKPGRRRVKKHPLDTIALSFTKLHKFVRFMEINNRITAIQGDSLDNQIEDIYYQFSQAFIDDFITVGSTK